MTDKPPSLDAHGLDNFAPYLMNRIMGRYNSAVNVEVAAFGLTTPKLRALAVLSVYDGILTKDLAVYTVVEQSTLSRALDGLEADKLIERRPDQADGRAFHIYLTETGRDAHARLWPHMEMASEALFKGVTTEERAALVGTLQKILRNIRKHDF